MKICVVTANMGSFDRIGADADQSIPYDRVVITDKDYPPRLRSMSARLQARIVKTHMWEFAPGYDYYLWIDGSCRLSTPESIEWFINELGEADIAVFKHPHRSTVQEEADYLRKRLAMGCPYITPRYENEDIEGQLAAVNTADQLYASTAFICKDSVEIKAAMKEWWYHISRYHSIDQLALPHVLRQLKVKVIPDNYLKVRYLEYVRNK
jgi:hypothetical protein